MAKLCFGPTLAQHHSQKDHWRGHRMHWGPRTCDRPDKKCTASVSSYPWGSFTLPKNPILSSFHGKSGKSVLGQHWLISTAEKVHERVIKRFSFSVLPIVIAHHTNSSHQRNFRVGFRGPEHSILFNRALREILESCPLRILILHEKREIEKTKNMAAFPNQIPRPPCFQKCKIHEPLA